jgi:hypothetical protein
MRTKISVSLAVLIFLSLATSACASLLRPVSGNPIDQAAQQTAVMATVSAVMTQQAFETLIAQATQMAIQAQATATPEPTETQQPTVIIATATSIPPTATATAVPTPCNWAQYVKDVTVSDGTEYSAGQKFTKTWRIKNIGTCTWTTSYDLVFVDGSAMSGPAAVDFASTVRPGETVDLSVELVSPSKEGSYKGYWMLRDENGKLFGVGSDTKQSFWVSIKVSGYKSDNVPTAIYPYDFTAGICQADWYSNAGKVARPCANVSQNESQWAAVLLNPKFETGSQENERSIWVHLNASKDWMQGFYPAQAVQAGDHFIAWIGCLDGSDTCNAAFSLDYKIDNGSVQNLGKWEEARDGKITKIDLDLSQLAGKNVQFILGVTNKNTSSPVNVFWFVPSIQHTSSS